MNGVSRHYHPRDKNVLLHARDHDNPLAGVIVAKTGARRVGVAVYREWMDVPIGWQSASFSYHDAKALHEALGDALADWPGEGPE